jgi:hypothetical protein
MIASVCTRGDETSCGSMSDVLRILGYSVFRVRTT